MSMLFKALNNKNLLYFDTEDQMAERFPDSK